MPQMQEECQSLDLWPMLMASRSGDVRPGKDTWL